MTPSSCSLDTATDYMHQANNKFYADHIADPDHPAIYWTDTTLTDPKGRGVYRSNRISCGWDETWTYIQAGDYHNFVWEHIDKELKTAPVGTSEEELNEAINRYIEKNRLKDYGIWTLRYMRHYERHNQVHPMRSTVGKIISANPGSAGAPFEPQLFYIVVKEKEA